MASERRWRGGEEVLWYTCRRWLDRNCQTDHQAPKRGTGCTKNHSPLGKASATAVPKPGCAAGAPESLFWVLQQWLQVSAQQDWEEAIRLVPTVVVAPCALLRALAREGTAKPQSHCESQRGKVSAGRAAHSDGCWTLRGGGGPEARRVAGG